MRASHSTADGRSSLGRSALGRGLRCAGALVSALSLMAATLCTTEPAVAAASTVSQAAPQLHVRGNQIVDHNGVPVVLRGVDRSGGEYACVQGFGIWDGQMDQQSVTAMKTWGITAVRMPLNEACWNGESYVNPNYAGAKYQSRVRAYVNMLSSNGIVAILDLHWTDGLYPGNSSNCSAKATCQKPMPDTAQAVPFWTSVARTFKNNDSVIFDLFNEPYPQSATKNVTSAWQCWLNGGTCTGIPYQVAGMQSLVNAVRSTGAANILMLGGLSYSNDLTKWLQYKPTDPDNNLIASWHSYNFNACSTVACWNSQIAPVITAVPVVAGEIGENDCSDNYINPLMTWLDAHATSYIAWTWNTSNCSGGPALITNYAGRPTNFGAGYKTHLLALATTIQAGH